MLTDYAHTNARILSCIQVVYTAEVKRVDRGGMQKMDYNDFLTALMKLAIRVYPRSKGVDEAFQRLLMDNVLPLASRCAPPCHEGIRYCRAPPCCRGFRAASFVLPRATTRSLSARRASTSQALP